MLGVDAETVLSDNTLQDLELEMEMSSKVGGVMGRYTFDPDMASTRWARLLIRVQQRRVHAPAGDRGEVGAAFGYRTLMWFVAADSCIVVVRRIRRPGSFIAGG
jgi:hypothetical protein